MVWIWYSLERDKDNMPRKSMDTEYLVCIRAPSKSPWEMMERKNAIQDNYMLTKSPLKVPSLGGNDKTEGKGKETHNKLDYIRARVSLQMRHLNSIKPI